MDSSLTANCRKYYKDALGNLSIPNYLKCPNITESGVKCQSASHGKKFKNINNYDTKQYRILWGNILITSKSRITYNCFSVFIHVCYPTKGNICKNNPCEENSVCVVTNPWESSKGYVCVCKANYIGYTTCGKK